MAPVWHVGSKTTEVMTRSMTGISALPTKWIADAPMLCSSGAATVVAVAVAVATQSVIEAVAEKAELAEAVEAKRPPINGASGKAVKSTIMLFPIWTFRMR